MVTPPVIALATDKGGRNVICVKLALPPFPYQTRHVLACHRPDQRADDYDPRASILTNGTSGTNDRAFELLHSSIVLSGSPR